MKVIVTIISLFFITSTSFAFSNSCNSLFLNTSQIYLKPINSKIATPDSLPTLERALVKLNEFIKIANGDKGTLSSIYKEALPQIEKTISLGQQILKSEVDDQNEVDLFFYQFSKIVDLAKDYAQEIGTHADGFAHLHRFTEEAYQERLDHFLRLYKSPLPILKNLIEVLDKTPRSHLTSSFKYISVDEVKLPDNLTFPFQYQYIFKDGSLESGVLDLLELFENRESGKVNMGVSFNEESPYDGQLGDSYAFRRHDLLHAYTQKFFDLLMFEEFSANTHKKRISLKMKSNALLKSRINEFQNISDKDFRDAIKIVYFALLHEQSRTYPTGMADELNTQKRFTVYQKSISTYVQSGNFGKQYAHIPKDLILTAIDWAKSRANIDARILRGSN